ncbi:hypothetical protein T459_35482 [Capsicum annuum]|uniref:NPH3 domain-containing protein n=1 Tax=Capsicum annuum TaxID=4072 RepID=A0A2G2XJ79_CAPAN|nr:hypothetical protein T459_35482 [Capsicum annuum]
MTTECLIRVLLAEDESVSSNFLLHLFKIGLIMNITAKPKNHLKTRIALMLEKCSSQDLLVRNSTTVFDVDIVVQVVEAYVSLASNNPKSRMFVVGRLVDEYLALIARNESLVSRSLDSLVNALPKEARFCDDNLYRYIDMYLKVNMTRLLISAGSSFQRTKSQTVAEPGFSLRGFRRGSDEPPITRWIRHWSQTIMKVSSGLGKSWVNSSQKEMKAIKQEIEMLKDQVGELQQRRMELQRQTKKPVFC